MQVPTSDVRVVVESRVQGSTKGNERLAYREGDMGVLTWSPREGTVNDWNPSIVWDHDPTRQERSIIAHGLVVVGLQIGSCRVLIK